MWSLQLTAAMVTFAQLILALPKLKTTPASTLWKLAATTLLLTRAHLFFVSLPQEDVPLKLLCAMMETHAPTILVSVLTNALTL